MKYRPRKAPLCRTFGKSQRFRLRRWLKRPEVLAAISAAVSAFATVGVLIANGFFAYYSRQQLDALKDQGTQINAQGNQAAQQFQVEQRPWVGVKFDYQPKYDQSHNLLVVGYHVQNVGKTPAHGIVVSGTGVIAPDPNPLIDQFMSMEPKTPDPDDKRFILLPGESTGSLWYRNVASSTWSDIRVGRTTLAFTLRLWYIDEFYKLYSVEFCGIWSPNFNGGWTACDRHNEERPTIQLIPL